MEVAAVFKTALLRDFFDGEPGIAKQDSCAFQPQIQKMTARALSAMPLKESAQKTRTDPRMFRSVFHGNIFGVMPLKIFECGAESRRKFRRFRIPRGNALKQRTEQGVRSGAFVAQIHRLQFQQGAPGKARGGKVYFAPFLPEQTCFSAEDTEEIPFSRFTELIVPDSRRNDQQIPGISLQRSERAFHTALPAENQQNFTAVVLMKRNRAGLRMKICVKEGRGECVCHCFTVPRRRIPINSCLKASMSSHSIATRTGLPPGAVWRKPLSSTIRFMSANLTLRSVAAR